MVYRVLASHPFGIVPSPALVVHSGWSGKLRLSKRACADRCPGLQGDDGRSAIEALVLLFR